MPVPGGFDRRFCLPLRRSLVFFGVSIFVVFLWKLVGKSLEKGMRNGGKKASKTFTHNR